MDDLADIRRAVHYCQAVGDDALRHKMEHDHGIRPGRMNRGRPAKNAEGKLAKF